MFTSVLIISTSLGKESCEQKAFVSSANKISLSTAEALGRSLIYNKNSSGPRFEPCGTPIFIGFREDRVPLHSTF